MPILQMIIGKKVVEELDIDLSNKVIVEHRLTTIENAAEYLKYKYRSTLALGKNWEIVLRAESKMNKKEY